MENLKIIDKRKVSIVLKRKLRSVTDWESMDKNLIKVNLNWVRKITIIGKYDLSENEVNTND